MRKKTPFYSLSTVVACVMILFLSASFAPSVLGSDSDRSPVTPMVKVSAKEKTAKEKPEWRRAILRWNVQARVKGYKIYMGTAPGTYTYQLDVGRRAQHKFDALPDGTYYFAVTSYDEAGRESPHSVEVSKTIPDKP